MAHIFVDAHGRELPMGENEPTLYGDRGDAALLENALKPNKPKLLARLWSRPSPSLDAQGPSGATPLTFAAAKGFVSDVETLLRHGANPEARDAWGNTPLATAARAACGGDAEALECVRRLAAVSSQETLSDVREVWDRTLRKVSSADSASADRAQAVRGVLQALSAPGEGPRPSDRSSASTLADALPVEEEPRAPEQVAPRSQEVAQESEIERVEDMTPEVERVQEMTPEAAQPAASAETAMAEEPMPDEPLAPDWEGDSDWEDEFDVETPAPEPRTPARPLTGQEQAQVALFRHIMLSKNDAMNGGHQDIVDALDAGADPNQRLTSELAAKLGPYYAEKVGQSALEMVVSNLVVHHDYDDEPYDYYGSDWSVIDSDAVPHVLQRLLARGGDPMQPTSRGSSLLQRVHFTMGSWRPALSTVEVLVEAGADINEQAGGMTLLDDLVSRWTSRDDTYPKMAENFDRLMNAGAALNQSAPGVEPTIALALRPSFPDKEVFETLLRHGASPNEINKDGVPLLSAAAERNEDQITLLLLSSGAEPNPSVAPEVSPLMIASKRGQPEVVEALLKAGARTDVQTQWGATPLSEAASHGEITTVERLMPYCTDDQIAAAAHAAVHAQSEKGEEAKRLRSVDNLAKRLNREQREPLEAKSHEEIDNLGWSPAEKHRVMPFLSASREERAISESIGLSKRPHAAQARSAVAMEPAAPSAQSSPSPASATNQRVAEPQVEKRRGMRL